MYYMKNHKAEEVIKLTFFISTNPSNIIFYRSPCYAEWNIIFIYTLYSSSSFVSFLFQSTAYLFYIWTYMFMYFTFIIIELQTASVIFDYSYLSCSYSTLLNLLFVNLNESLLFCNYPFKCLPHYTEKTDVNSDFLLSPTTWPSSRWAGGRGVHDL